MATELDLPSLLQIPISDPLPESDVNTILSFHPFVPIPYALNLRTLTSPSLKPISSSAQATYPASLPLPLHASKMTAKLPLSLISGMRKKERGNQLLKLREWKISGCRQSVTWILSTLQMGLLPYQFKNFLVSKCQMILWRMRGWMGL